MSSALINEDRKLHGSGDGNGGNGHATRGRGSVKAHQAEDDTTRVLEEIMRLVDASKEGRLSERGRAVQFNDLHREIILGVN